MQLPTHLDSKKAEGLIPEELIAQYELGTMRNFVYLVIDWSSKSAWMVDPQKDLRPLEDLAEHGLHLKGVLLTHTHHDHVAGVPALLEVDPDLKIYLHKADAHRLKNVSLQNLHYLSDGEALILGTTQARVLHSPGHSAGEITYKITPPAPHTHTYLLTGDTLFIRDCGRTDLPTGNDQEMFETLQKIRSLPDHLVILPGHHYSEETSSFLGNEKRASPPLLCKSLEELKSLP